ncbi:MAG: imidazoleglycerol-phosphate dehydratase [Planctomycetes bacterium DG_23]|nr:MAG: imidazoleglycerol-phosphate dehydratase [Planctomycetes bacterium DG_23]
MGNRKNKVQRKTKETEVDLALDLDGRGDLRGSCGVGFMNHMLELLAKHSSFDLVIKATGDREVDDHHLVEDVGICLGRALKKALGDVRGAARFGWASCPMDEALAQVAIDLSGRALLVFNVPFPAEKIGTFDTTLLEEFLRAFATNAALTLHINVPYGKDAHHIAEAIFKALAKALKQATRLEPGAGEIPSTKGVID